jgi:hypothetical protein
MFRTRIDAIISKKRWNDQTDEEFFINEDWSIELELETQPEVDKLTDLNSKSNFNSYELPDVVNHHLHNSNEIDFDETTDKILKISSFYRQT